MIKVRPLDSHDREWATDLVREHWQSTKTVTRGRIHFADELPSYVAVRDAERIGLVTYRIDNCECEIVTMNSLVERIGVGTALLDDVKATAKSAGCRRLWLVTTNDNLAAMRFYEKRGFHFAAIHPNAIEVSRKVKPEIPILGLDGIPIRDEIELEILL